MFICTCLHILVFPHKSVLYMESPLSVVRADRCHLAFGVGVRLGCLRLCIPDLCRTVPKAESAVECLDNYSRVPVSGPGSSTLLDFFVTPISNLCTTHFAINFRIQRPWVTLSTYFQAPRQWFCLISFLNSKSYFIKHILIIFESMLLSFRLVS